MADDPHDGIALLPSDETEFRIRFLSTEEPRVGPNQVHLHLTSHRARQHLPRRLRVPRRAGL